MKNYDEMYQSVLSKYDEYLEQKKKRIRTIRRTVPVLVCFCFMLVFGPGHWDHLKDLMHPPIQPDIIEEQPTDTPVSTIPSDIAGTTESSSTKQEKPTVSAAATHSMPQAVTNGTSVTGIARTITTAVSAENGGRKNPENSEAVTPAATATVSEIIPVSPPQTTSNIIQTNPATRSTAPIKVTDVPPATTEIEPQPVNNDSRLLYPIGKQISIERYKAMAAASYMIYNDIQTSAITTKGTGTTRTTAVITPEITTTTVTPDDTQIALKKLTEKENRLFGEFQRERAVLLGDLSPDAPRLTLDEAAAIIDSSGSFTEICRKLHETQPLPDYIGGSGITRLEYWFDDKGSQKIYLIMEEESIFYFNLKGADMIYS